MMVDAAVLILQTAVGVFYAISGFHKLFNKQRQEAMRETLRALHIPFVEFNRYWVPGWEFVGGIGLMISRGIVADFFAFVLLVITIIACCTDGPRKVRDMRPMDFADRVDDWLYLPETLLAVILVAVILL